jgi:hypothetical protein
LDMDNIDTDMNMNINVYIDTTRRHGQGDGHGHGHGHRHEHEHEHGREYVHRDRHRWTMDIGMDWRRTWFGLEHRHDHVHEHEDFLRIIGQYVDYQTKIFKLSDYQYIDNCTSE